MMGLLAVFPWHTFFFVLFAVLACGFGLAVLFSSNIVRMAFYLVLSLGATAGLFFLAGADFVGTMQLLIYVGGTLVLLVFGVMLTAQQSFIRMHTRGGEWVLAAVIGGALLLLLWYAAVSVEGWQSPREAAVRGLDARGLADAERALDAGRLPEPLGRALAERGLEVEPGAAVEVAQPGRQWRLAMEPRDVRLVRERIGGEEAFGVYREVPRAARHETTRLGMALMGVRVDQLDGPQQPGRSGYLLPFIIVSVHLLVVLIGAAYLARGRRPADNAQAAARRR